MPDLSSGFSGELCFFVSDLHGDRSAYAGLFFAIRHDRPVAVFLGGDLTGGSGMPEPGAHSEPTLAYLTENLRRLQQDLGAHYPRIFVILGNDDPAFYERDVVRMEAEGLWNYVHMRCRSWKKHTVCGMAFIPPSPFRLKDWERFDVSRYADPGCYPPAEGMLTVPVSDSELRHRTISDYLKNLFPENQCETAVCLFHAPPYGTALDRAELDGKKIDHVPLDPHVGSIAIRRFIEEKQPLLTLHGHVHEASRLSGRWLEPLGNTIMISAAHEKKPALVRFEIAHPENARRELL